MDSRDSNDSGIAALEPPPPDDAYSSDPGPGGGPNRGGPKRGGPGRDGGGFGGGRPNGARPAGTSGRMLPHSMEAEVSVLGSALISRHAATSVLEILSPDDFYRSAHGVVFEAIQDLAGSGTPVDTVTVLEWARNRHRLDEIGGPTAVSDLAAAAPTAANAEHYAKIVKDNALLRRLIEAGTEVVRMGFDDTEDALATVDRAESVIFKVAEQGANTDYSALKDMLPEAFERLEALAHDNSEVTGLPTGFDDLDRLTAGLQPENLIILAARPAMGKSSLSLNLAQYVTVSLKKPAIIFSLEMSKIEIVNRMLSAEAGIDSNKIKTGRFDDRDWRRLGDALGRLNDAPLFIDDTPSISMLEITAKCRRLKQKHGLALVVIDYLQLMSSHGKSDSRQQEVAEISRGLKMLAKDLKVPVIALSQLSRQPESRVDKRPMLSDLRESGCLTRDTRVFRADTGSPITFGELVDGDIRDIQVWARDEHERLVPSRLTHAFPSGTKEAFLVRTASGMTVEATANHPFLTLDGWQPLGELGVGSRIAVARTLPEPTDPQAMDPDELVLLAHMLGEGTMVARQPVHYTSADADNLDVVEKAAWNRFGITARRDADGRSAVTTQLHLPSPVHLTHGVRNPIAAWLDGLGLWDHRSWQKFLPAEVFALPDDQVRTFLHHLWATDGCIWVRPDDQTGPRVRIYYATASAQLAKDVQLALLRLGIASRIARPKGREGTRQQHHVTINGVTAQRRFLELVGCHGERGRLVQPALAALADVTANTNADTIPREIWNRVRALLREQGITQRAFAAMRGASYGGTAIFKNSVGRGRLAEIAGLLGDERLQDLASSDLMWDEIVEVTSLGEQEVFDATVEEHHSFVAEGLVLHNSIEQDADIVGFIYRDEVYDEQSPEKGIAELIIAKHRNGQVRTVKLAFLNHLTKFANLAPRPPGSGGGGGGGMGGPPPPPPPPESPL